MPYRFDRVVPILPRSGCWFRVGSEDPLQFIYGLRRLHLFRPDFAAWEIGVNSGMYLAPGLGQKQLTAEGSTGTKTPPMTGFLFF